MWILKVDGQDPFAALAGFFRTLLKEAVAGALLLPQRTGGRVAYTLVTRPEGIYRPDPFAPVVYGNAAGLVRELAGSDRKIGAVLRPCEIRTLIELAKLNQVELDNLFIIGIDCPGAFSPAAYRAFFADEQDVLNWLQKTASGVAAAPEGAPPRRACLACAELTPAFAHLTIGWLGTNPLKELAVEGEYRLPADKFLLSPGSPPVRKDLILAWREKKAAQGEKMAAEFKERVSSPRALLNELASCLRCYNCRTVCPLCICQECIFISPLFKHSAQTYLSRAEKRLSTELPADTLLFHLTRMAHVGLSCVGCGHCEEACPSGLPLALLFKTAAREVQSLFDYVPGRSPEEKLPLTTYQLHELEQKV